MQLQLVEAVVVPPDMSYDAVTTSEIVLVLLYDRTTTMTEQLPCISITMDIYP